MKILRRLIKLGLIEELPYELDGQLKWLKLIQKGHAEILTLLQHSRLAN
jgi:DNA-binding MarR family transcriptional regulator